MRDAGQYIGLGTTLAATVLLGVGGGYWVDKKWGTEPIGLLVGALFGMASGFYNLYRLLMRPRS